MKMYGSEMMGQFIIEKRQTLPEWSKYDEGRFLYVIDDNKYYIGGLTDWLNLNIGSKIGSDSLDTGSGKLQINASKIPVLTTTIEYNDPTSIQSVLDNLAKGYDIQDSAIIARHLAKKSVTAQSLLTGYNSTTAINSNSIPCKNKILNYDNPPVSTIQDTIDMLIQYCPFIIRQKIQLTAWEYSPSDELYRATINTSPIREKSVLVQCYDSSGSMVLPAKIDYDPSYNRIYVWSPYKLVITVVVVG